MIRGGWVGSVVGVVLACGVGRAMAQGPQPIQRVEISPQRTIVVNGKAFLPIMAWLQDPANFSAIKQCGMNTVAGYWRGSGGTKNVSEYLDLVEKAGLYGVMPFDERLQGRSALLAYIHDDEPDLPHEVTDANVVPGQGLRLNPKTPLWRLVDGVTHSWSVLDPLDQAAVTIRLKQPVTATSLAVWQTISPGLSVAKEIAFEADGKPVLKVTVEAKRGRQNFDLPKPATFRELTLRVCSVHPGQQAWGSLGEIEALDAQGRNVLSSPPRNEPRARPDQVLHKYQQIKAADPTRPVFMTLTGYFHPHFRKWTEPQRQSLYPAYVAAADVVGYDIYPIYGWNKPEWIHLVHEATAQLAELAAPRPIYAWIETSKGGQWTGPLEQQKEVTPTHIRAEVWMALCGGATAIGYFTHVWKPSYQQFGVPEENRRALRSINEQLTRLAPAILAPACPHRIAVVAEGTKVAFSARIHQGQRYLFAVNYDERLRNAEATFQVEGLAAGTTIDVIDEDRTLRAEPGAFRDAFEPLAVHLYRIDDRR